MHLTFIDIFDLFFRFALIGQFILLAAFILNKSRHFKSLLLIILIVCAASYLLLTPQIPDHHYGALRGVLLFFTDLLPYVCWLYVFALLNDDFHPKNWPISINALLVGFVLWMMYFFIYLQGNGQFHQINHAIEALVTLHILYVALKDLQDDLVDSRRKKRMLLVFCLAGYGFVLTVFELTKATMVHTSLFSLINSSLIFIGFNFYYFRAIKLHHKQQKQSVSVNLETAIEEQSGPHKVPALFQENFAKLTEFIETGNFKKTELTIKQLAIELHIPEHHLRELINQCLGFKNFSSFLNSYRIPAACLQFANIANIRKPILTIALELGYGSIGPFNRAFKDITGQTPSQYRQSAIK